jgi:uncharacterized protein (DUF736 family)|tara:strand:+ start:2917 stop:3123 length:207 start_codon:yes stop_codon:yes gene_type:complete
MAFELKDDHGSLWKNENKEKENQPDYTGKINIGGSIMQLGGWKNTTKAGKQYVSIKVSPVQAKEEMPF